MSDGLLQTDWKRRFRGRLISWFDRTARDLPWRRSRDPYSVWVSEVMLQQTQVATVIPYYERFLNAFPTIESIAAASEQQVLRLWEGLGYYRRARQLHRAAQIMVDQHGGKFPSEPEIVQRLPGIGRYTAGAVLSIAFDQRLPILEANTQRLYARLLAYEGDIQSNEGRNRLWQFAGEILPRTDVGRFNQALMELGATICTPREPQCQTCPVANLCAARAQGKQEKIPGRVRKMNYEDAHEACVVVWRRNRVLMRQCAEGERWAGLWDFPRFPFEKLDAASHEKRLVSQVQTLTGVVVAPAERIATIKHGVTRFRITLDCYEARWVQGSTRPPNLQWIEPHRMSEYPLSMTARKISRLLIS